MNHHDEIDHDEHAAVQADIDAEHAAEDPRGKRLQNLASQITEIRHVADRSEVAINAAGQHDNPDDAEHELLALEGHMKEILSLSIEVLALLGEKL